MDRIAIRESKRSIRDLLWLMLFFMPAVNLYLFVVLREDIHTGQFQIKHLLVANGTVSFVFLGAWIKSFWSTKNFYYDPTNRGLYFTRPLLFRWKHKQFQVGEPEKVVAVNRISLMSRYLWKIPSIGIRCRGKKLNDYFFIDCDSMDEAQHLAQKLREVASLNS